MITVVGNHTRGYLGRGIDGVGVSQGIAGTGYVTVAASKAGDQHVQQLVGLKSDIQMGIYIQSSVPVEVEYTLSNPRLADDPDPAINADTLWSPPETVPAGEIYHSEHIVTAFRLTFSAPGVLSIGVS